MGSDLSFVVARAEDGAVVFSAWIGRRGVRERAEQVLGRPADRAARGFEWWAITGEEAVAIAASAYEDGATEEEIAPLVERWPAPTYWWVLERSF